MWFNDEVLVHRFAFSVMWMLLLQFFLIDGFYFTVKVVSWHPWLGLQDWVASVFCLRSLCFHFLFGFTFICFAILHTRYCAVDRIIYSSRIEAIWTFISPSRVFHWLCHAILGMLNTYGYIQYFGGINKDPSYIESIFQWQSWPDVIFIIFHGLYVGGLYSWKYFGNDWYLISYELVQPSKLTLGSKTFGILFESMQHNARSLHWYYLMYVFCGSYLVNWIVTTFGIEDSHTESPAFFSIMSFNPIMVSIFTGTIMYLTWIFYLKLFNMFISERFEFRIEANSEVDKQKVLCKALTCSDHKLLQYHAFMDMRWLSQYSSSRRAKIFAISQPGGHPHLWHSLSCICMTSLSQFLVNLKNLAIVERGNGIKMHLAAVDTVNLENPVTAIAERVQEYFRQKPLYKYFFEDLPDTEALRTFSSCQLQIWTIEALGFLIAASYTEDKFGVVQRTLPKILCLLIDLKVCEEKLPLGFMSMNKNAKNTKFMLKGVSLRHTLKSALESTLYRIVLTYKTDIKGIFVPDEYHRYLDKYLEFKK